MERTMRVVTLLIRFLAIATITFSIGLCNGNSGWPPLCKESERQALLMFKQDLKDPANRLASWVAEEDSDCCSWTGVVYDHITGHVHELHLNSSVSDREFNSCFGGHGEKSTFEMGTKGNKLAEPVLRRALLKWALSKGRKVGEGHGEKSTLEMVRCTNMGKARQGKAGILLWMRRPITRLSCELNLEKGHLASTLPLILDCRRFQLVNHQMNFLQYRAAQKNLLIHILGCNIVGVLGLIVEILITREGPFLEIACILIAGLTIILWLIVVVSECTG